jgi:hypothetical protein
MTKAAATQPRPAPRRVRDEARDVAALMVFSGVTSLALAVALVVISHLGQG